MSVEQGMNPDIDWLIQTTPEQEAEEKALKVRGYIPERWGQIEALEVSRLQTEFVQALQQLQEKMDEVELADRSRIARVYLLDQLLMPDAPSVLGGPHGPFAAAHWRNLSEMLTRVIDLKQAETMMPDVDSRVPFWSGGLEKQWIILSFLIERIQQALADEQLTETHLREIFTNVSPHQLEVVVAQIASSALPLQSESPKQRWARIVKESTAPPTA